MFFATARFLLPPRDGTRLLWWRTWFLIKSRIEEMYLMRLSALSFRRRSKLKYYLFPTSNTCLLPVHLPFWPLTPCVPGSRRVMSAANRASPSLLKHSISRSAFFSEACCNLSAWLAAAAACLIWCSLFSSSISKRRALCASVKPFALEKKGAVVRGSRICPGTGGGVRRWWMLRYARASPLLRHRHRRSPRWHLQLSRPELKISNSGRRARCGGLD